MPPMTNMPTPVLVPISEGSEGNPIFLVHPLHGSSHCYLSLAAELEGIRPTYALQSRGLGERTPKQRSVEEMAADYVTAIQSVQTDGPFLLAGWSLGGWIALEMAHILRQKGKEIAFLFSIDRILTKGQIPGDPDYWILQIILREKFDHEILAAYKSLNSDLEKAVFLYEKMKKDGEQPTNIRRSLNLLEMVRQNYLSSLHYKPNPGDFPIVYFLAPDPMPVPGGADYLGYWFEDLPTSDVHFIEGCHHLSILNRPAVEFLAEKMSLYLEN